MKVWLIDNTENAEQIIETAYLACRNIVDLPEDVYRKYTLAERIEQIFRDGHLGLLEHAIATFHVEGISRSCTHQLVRHRIASYAHLSMRHVKPDIMGTIMPETIQEAGMGSAFLDAFQHCRDVYQNMVEEGVPEEDARFIIPMGIETQIVITMNFRAWIHFLKLRTHKSAQWEIRAVANDIWRYLKGIAPEVFDEAYQEYWR